MLFLGNEMNGQPQQSLLLLLDLELGQYPAGVTGSIKVVWGAGGGGGANQQG
jgi:hypothetical protein